MDAPFLTPTDLIRPWRRATIIATAVAAIELLALVGVGLVVFGKPLEHLMRGKAAAVAHHTASTADTKTHKAVSAVKTPAKVVVAPAKKLLARSHVRVMVLNGNGQNGAAGSEATKLGGLGYRIAGTANAHRQDYATSVVMYRPGYAAEARRLAHDLGVKVVGPLDGIADRALHGGQVAVIVGA